MNFSVGKNPVKIGKIRAQLKKICYTVILVTEQQKNHSLHARSDDST